MNSPKPSKLVLRMPRLEDETQAKAAQVELAADNFDFLLGVEGQSWAEYLESNDRDHRGIDLAPGRVPATMLFAVVEPSNSDELSNDSARETIVGRAHIRHELTPELLRVNGHIGYGVRPDFRRRGYATQILGAGLDYLAELGVERALVTCDDDNVASARTIERNGGVLENVVADGGDVPTRRYWVDLNNRR